MNNTSYSQGIFAKVHNMTIDTMLMKYFVIAVLWDKITNLSLLYWDALLNKVESYKKNLPIIGNIKKFHPILAILWLIFGVLFLLIIVIIYGLFYIPAFVTSFIRYLFIKNKDDLEMFDQDDRLNFDDIYYRDIEKQIIEETEENQDEDEIYKPYGAWKPFYSDVKVFKTKLLGRKYIIIDLDLRDDYFFRVHYDMQGISTRTYIDEYGQEITEEGTISYSCGRPFEDEQWLDLFAELSDKKYNVGIDEIIVLGIDEEKTKPNIVFVRAYGRAGNIINEATLHCAATYLHKKTKKTKIDIETVSGIMQCLIEKNIFKGTNIKLNGKTMQSTGLPRIGKIRIEVQRLHEYGGKIAGKKYEK